MKKFCSIVIGITIIAQLSAVGFFSNLEKVKASDTNIDGLYYFHTGEFTHHQNGGYFGTGFDIGFLNRTAPTDEESDTYCGGWIQFYFDEDGTYTQENTINNIYYHTWWGLQNTPTTDISYDSSGQYGINRDGFISVNKESAQAQVNGNYLTANKRTLDTPLAITGEDIYNFGIKFGQDEGYFPSVRTSKNQASFILLNVPSDLSETKGFLGEGHPDYNNDGISDYDALYTYFTNPYETDTDQDGFSDKYEIDHGMNPLDAEKAPVFGNQILSQIDGAVDNNNFGRVTHSMNDLNGDGKDEIVVSSNTDAKIYSVSGNLIRRFPSNPDDIIPVSTLAVFGNNVLIGTRDDKAYLYSATTGNLLHEFNAEVADSGFGTSVALSSNYVLIGAPQVTIDDIDYTGEAYLYSISTGELLHKFDGEVENMLGLGSKVALTEGQILVSGPNTGNNTGVVNIYSTSTYELLHQFNGVNDEDLFGINIAIVGETVLVSAINMDPNDINNAGSVYLYSLSDYSLLHRFDGTIAGQWFGSDLDGFGNRIIIGSSGFTVGGKLYSGAAFLYSSTDYELLHRFDGPEYNIYFGSAVSAIGDQDGDGIDDIVIAAPYADPNGITDAGSVYVYSSVGYISDQSWSKWASLSNAFDLDDYFSDANNSTIPDPTDTSFSVSGNSNIAVSINSTTHQVSFSTINHWSGSETVTFRATDPYTGDFVDSNEVTLTVNDIADTTGPTLTISSPTDGSSTSASSVTVTGSATDSESGVASLTINGVSISNPASFSATVLLSIGVNTITIVATDNANNSTTKTLSITRTAPASTGTNIPSIADIIRSVSEPSSTEDTVADNNVPTISTPDLMSPDNSTSLTPDSTHSTNLQTANQPSDKAKSNIWIWLIAGIVVLVGSIVVIKVRNNK